MEILKRAKGHSGEIVSFGTATQAYKDEVNRRTCKAGYTDRDGQPPLGGIRSKPSNDKYRKNYVKVFGHE